MNVRCQYARQLYFCMSMINLTRSYFNLYFTCHGSAGWAATVSGILPQLQKICEVHIRPVHVAGQGRRIYPPVEMPSQQAGHMGHLLHMVW